MDADVGRPRTEPMSADLVEIVLGEISDVLGRVSRTELADLADRLDGAAHVFVAGEGRSGYIARSFAMRLMHLGVPVHVVGETTTPPVAAGDAVVAVSGSGTTAATVRVAEKAVAAGAALYAVTSDADSPLAREAEIVLTVPGATTDGESGSVQLLNSLFDQATYVVLDVVCLDLARRRGVDDAAAHGRHADSG